MVRWVEWARNEAPLTDGVAISEMAKTGKRGNAQMELRLIDGVASKDDATGALGGVDGLRRQLTYSIPDSGLAQL